MAIDLGQTVHQKSHFPPNVSLDALRSDVAKIYQIWDLLQVQLAGQSMSEDSTHRQRDMFIKIHGAHHDDDDNDNYYY
jgi:hypothetical protein